MGEDLDVCEAVRCRGFTGGVAPMRDELALECPDNAFTTGVVPPVPLPAPAGGEPLGLEEALGAWGRLLTAAVRVGEESRHRRSVRPRHPEGPLGQSAGQSLAPRPPITRREERSSRTARESPPSTVQPSVLSPAHPRLGAATGKVRARVVAATGNRCWDWVGARPIVIVLARRPAWRISRATRCAPTRCPRRTSTCQRLGLPSGGRLAGWRSRLSVRSARGAALRRLSGRPRQAY